MATSLLDADEGQDDASKEDEQSSFIRHIANKYEKEDSANFRKEDGDEEGEGDDDSDAEHTDSETSTDDPDGDTAESDKDSTDDDDTDHTDDDESKESDDDENADDLDDDEVEEEEEEDADDGVSDETKALLTKAGADLKLEDIPEKYRGIVDKKLRSVDSAFTRYAKEATAFRADRTKFEAEEAFRTEHTDLYIAEMLQKSPELFEKVNARIAKLEDPDNAEAFGIIVKGKRQDALATAQEAARVKDEEATAREQARSRGDHVYNLAMRLAAKAGLSPRAADLAIGAALLQKPEDKRDISDAEVAAIIAAEAKAFKLEDRGNRRAHSKEKIQARTATKKAAAPATRKGSAIVSPRPGKTKQPVVDMDNEESRHAALMRSMRRIVPGTK